MLNVLYLYFYTFKHIVMRAIYSLAYLFLESFGTSGKHIPKFEVLLVRYHSVVGVRAKVLKYTVLSDSMGTNRILRGIGTATTVIVSHPHAVSTVVKTR